MPFECNISSVEVQVELREKVVQVQVVLERLEAVIFIVNPIHGFDEVTTEIGEIPTHTKTKKANKGRIKYIAAEKDELETEREWFGDWLVSGVLS